MHSFTPAPGYRRIKLVKSFEELVSTPFKDGINALCWPRTLPGNFSEIVEQLVLTDEITTLDDAQLQALSLGAEGSLAREILLQDQALLRPLGLSPILDCIRSYPRDENPEVVCTDVYSFHADSATVAADTYLCSYLGTATEGLRNEEAQRHVDIPETRAELLKRFGQEENDAFLEHLTENCYDLHYSPIAQAQPFSFGLGNLWRIAIEYPGCPVPPCIHRAPRTIPGQAPRLLLIS